MSACRVSRTTHRCLCAQTARVLNSCCSSTSSLPAPPARLLLLLPTCSPESSAGQISGGLQVLPTGTSVRCSTCSVVEAKIDNRHIQWLTAGAARCRMFPWTKAAAKGASKVRRVRIPAAPRRCKRRCLDVRLWAYTHVHQLPSYICAR